MAPPKLYGWAISPFVSRALLALEEAGVEYELVPMSRQDGDRRRPEHIARNSRAIGRHVLRKHKPELLGEGSLEKSALVDVWVEVEAHQLHPVTGAIAPFLGRARNQAVIDENVEKLEKVLEAYEARLGKCRYLAGDFLSFADLSHFTFMHYFMATEYAAMVDAHPHVRAWWEELAARPAAGKVALFMPLDFGVGKKDEE